MKMKNSERKADPVNEWPEDLFEANYNIELI